MKKKNSSAQTTQSVTIERSDSALKAPASVEAGLAEITVKNTGKKPGGAQLVRVTGDQTAEEVGKAGQAWVRRSEPLPDSLKLPAAWATPSRARPARPAGTCPPANTTRSTSSRTRGAPPQVTAAADSPALGGPRVVAVDYSFKATGLEPGKQTVLSTTKATVTLHSHAAINQCKTIADVAGRRVRG